MTEYEVEWQAVARGTSIIEAETEDAAWEAFVSDGTGVEIENVDEVSDPTPLSVKLF